MEYLCLSRLDTMKEQEIFIPEKFLGRTAFITHVFKHGWGYVLKRTELGEAIKDGRINHEVLLAGAIIPLPKQE